MNQTFIRIILLVALSFGSKALAQKAMSCESPYRFGAGQGDITGPIAEAALNGYGDFSHVAEGLHQRLRSRAFVIEDPCQQGLIALVINDLAMIHHNVRSEVLRRLNQKAPGVFDESNLMLSATHTHAGHGAYSHYILYNVTSLGYSSQAFEAIVTGTVEAVMHAYRNLESADLRISEAALDGPAWNRSLEAYEQNPIAERERYGVEVDTDFVQLSAYSDQGDLLASLIWHAVHPVSLPMDNRLVSGDNKGLAAYWLEQHFGTRYQSDRDYIAGFFQANSGDISPYDFRTPLNGKADYWQRLEKSAQAQVDLALQLLSEGGGSLEVRLASRHQYVDLHKLQVDSKFNAGNEGQTCRAALGVSFAAGTENGQPVDWFSEGTVWGVNWPKITLMPREQSCHAEKVLLLPTGQVSGWTAHILPYQLFVIGELAVVAAPFEATTMAGRRFKAMIRKALAEYGVRYVAFTALANEYSHYVTTPEEYRAQNYEVGSTLFGPLSYAAHSQIFYGLASAIRGDYAVPKGPRPPDLEHQSIGLRPGVVFDSTPIGQSFGDVYQEPSEVYERGQTLETIFWGAHPKNDLRRSSSYLTIERDVAGQWQAKYFDWDHQTRLYWERKGLASSHMRVQWQIDEQSPKGRYRVCHEGKSKSVTGTLKPYRGCSRPFVVVASH